MENGEQCSQIHRPSLLITFEASLAENLDFDWTTQKHGQNSRHIPKRQVKMFKDRYD